MKFNLTKKYFIVSAVTIAFVLVILMIVNMLFQAEYVRKDKLDMLERNAIAISEAVKDVEEDSDYYSVLNRTGAAFSSNEIIVFFTLGDGHTFLCTENQNTSDDCPHYMRVVNESIMQQIKMHDKYSEFGNLGGIYKNDYFTAGAQLLDGNRTMNGAVFVSLSSQSYDQLLKETFFLLLVTVIISMFLLYVVIYLITRKTLKPLADMSSVTKEMANGNFSSRVEYRSKDEVGELARSFNHLCDSMEVLENARSSFIANVSHEFKTPITVISGYIDGILDGTIADSDQKHYLKVVSDEVKRLNVMVNSMLQLSKLESGKNKLQYQKNNLDEMIFTIFLSFETRISEKNIDVYGLDALGTITTECDHDLIYNAIYNLVDNAVKFTPEYGYISVTKEESGNTVSLFIKNNGPGIEAEDLAHIFDRFYKTDKSRSVDKSGTGLGLYIVKNVVHYHGGAVYARSKPGTYTEFQIDLPKFQS